MNAVIEVKGHQFRVTTGSVVYTPLLNPQEMENSGSLDRFINILLFEKDGNVVLNPTNIKIEAEYSIFRSAKVTAFKMKRRKGFRKKHGHKTFYTKVTVKNFVELNAEDLVKSIV